MLGEVIREIEEMEYPCGEIIRGLRAEGINDRGGAAAYGFGEAQERIVGIIRSHSNDGWIPCSEGMPENEKEVEITYIYKPYLEKGKTCYGTARAFYTDGTMTTEESNYCWENTEELDYWEYCEEEDVTYIPEGWWEHVAFSETFSAVDDNDYKVIAWRPRPEPYRPQKSVGEDYKQQIMGRFMKTE